MDLRNKLAKLVERDWVAMVAAISAFLLSLASVLRLLSGNAVSALERWLGSERGATFVGLVTLVIVPASAALAIHGLIAGPLRRSHRRRLGLCVKCGYDLTGNVSGVCPECGTPT